MQHESAFYIRHFTDNILQSACHVMLKQLPFTCWLGATVADLAALLSDPACIVYGDISW